MADWSPICYLKSDGKTINCADLATFNSARPRWWFFVISRCDTSNLTTTVFKIIVTNISIIYKFENWFLKKGVKIDYNITLTNGDDIFHKQFSADEFGNK